MTDDERELIIQRLLKSKKIKKIYDDYIIKSIPFEKWVTDTVEHLMHPVEIDADVILDDMKRRVWNEA